LAIEQHLNGAINRIDEAVKSTKEWEFYQNFWRNVSQDLEPYRTEWEVWDEEHKLTGSIDMVFKRKSDGAFVIYDWKRSKEIKKDNKFDSGLGPMTHLPNANYWHYTLQLNIYRWFLQKNYGLKIVDLAIVILHPNNTNYQIFHLNILDDEVAAMLDCRKRAIESGSKNPVEFEDTPCELEDD
jgi:ATP-dependent exoDNAse (exonuclease V) beta subunit